jgi:chlorobactene glucosyltransferase
LLAYLTHHLAYHLIVFQAVLILIALSNARTLRQARRHPTPARFPKVSVLVPARNEEAAIARCVASLLAQDYPDFEVLVLDDESTDRTRPILQSLAASDARLRVLEGRPPEAGWLGKPWACAQLAAQATGEVLYFTDADTCHRPDALRAAVTALEGEGADLLSGFPRQELRTWGERLIVPFFSWVTFVFIPLRLAYRIKLPALSCAIGQMLLIRRTAYEATGGHGAVRAEIAEDLALTRRVKAQGYRWRMMRAVDLISCRMYRNGREAVAGLSKNLFAAFGFRLAPYLFAWLWLALMALAPVVTLGLYGLGAAPDVPLAATLTCIGLALLLWSVPYRALGLPLYLAGLYPVIVLVMQGVAWRSLWLSLTGRLTWKGRALTRPRIRVW